MLSDSWYMSGIRNEDLITRNEVYMCFKYDTQLCCPRRTDSNVADSLKSSYQMDSSTVGNLQKASQKREGFMSFPGRR